MLENYNKARNYLYKADPENYKDILHDAFLNYHRRTGLNLFDRPNYNVIGVIKNQWFEHLRSTMYKKNGVRVNYSFVSFDNHTVTKETPLDFLIQEDTYNFLKKRANGFREPELAKDIIDLRYQGFSSEEISNKMGLSIHQVKRYLNNLQKDRSGRADKLTKQQVLQIRKDYSEGGVSLAELGIKYNVVLHTIWSIVNNKSWKKV